MYKYTLYYGSDCPIVLYYTKLYSTIVKECIHYTVSDCIFPVRTRVLRVLYDGARHFELVSSTSSGRSVWLCLWDVRPDHK